MVGSATRVVAVVLAAGQGTRLRSSLPKVLHPAAGRPLLGWVLQGARSAGCQDIIVVVGHGWGGAMALATVVMLGAVSIAKIPLDFLPRMEFPFIAVWVPYQGGIHRHNFDSHDEMNAYQRSGYSETDARAALMAFDFLSSVQEAKQYIGLKVINGAESILHDVGITSGDYDAHECLAAYRQAGYTNADADKAAAGWSFLDGRDDAREYIGLKVLNGYEHKLAEVGIEPRYANDMYGYKGKDDAGYWSKDAVYKGKYDTDYDYKYGGYDKGPDYASKSAYYGKMNYYSKVYAGKYGK